MKEVNVEYVELMENGEKKKLHDEIMDMPDMDDEEFEKLADKHDRMIGEDEAQERELDKFDELIKKQEERENEMKKVYNDYFDQMAELGDKAEQYEDVRLEELSIFAEKARKEMIYDMVPRKGITVKLLPEAHKELKLIATSKDTTLEMIVTSIVENEIYHIDIGEYVSEKFEYDAILIFHEEDKQDAAKMYYDMGVSKKLIKGKPRKRINVKVDDLTHRKLRIISATQDRSLDNIVSEILENEVGITIDKDKILEEMKANKNNE